MMKFSLMETYLRLIILTTAALLVTVCSLSHAESIKLVTNLSPPYQVVMSGKISGTSVETLKCILDKVEFKSEIQILPWKRAIKHLELGIADALFSASYQNDINSFASLSAPIAIEKWYFFQRYNAPSKVSLSTPIGVILGSNQDKWLTRQGYKSLHRISSYEQLIKLVSSSRVNVVAADAQAFSQALILSRQTNQAFAKTFIKYAPLGVYFNHQFVEDHSNFLNRFNAQTHRCSRGAIALDKDEQAVLMRLAARQIELWSSNLNVIKAIEAHNAKLGPLSEPELYSLDQRWRRNRSSFEAHAQLLKANQLSEHFQRIKKESNGLYTEIFAMGRNGLTVAMSDLPSDLWQGDEDKFTQTYSVGPNALHIDQLRYDESTYKFQVQISMTINDMNHQPIGALTVGIDVESALASQPFRMIQQ